jgi:hypothetical protein
LDNLSFEIPFSRNHLEGSEGWSISPFACTSFV